MTCHDTSNQGIFLEIKRGQETFTNGDKDQVEMKIRVGGLSSCKQLPKMKRIIQNEK